jgi:replication factor C subunit 3/5
MNPNLTTKSTLPWIEKYRPDQIEDIISHKDILNTLSTLMEKNNFPHIILYGPPGTGKTTTILACAKHMFGPSFANMVLELNGSDDRGINVVREQIKDFSQSDLFSNEIFNINKKNHKLVILDEADSMTYDAQFALRRVIETYTSTTRFCLICNYSTKIIPSLQSRCITFRFSPIPVSDHIAHIKKIVELESMNLDDPVIHEIIRLSDGDMRKSINVLQSLFMTCGQKHIDMNSLYKNIGYPLPKEKQEIINKILSLELADSFEFVKKIELDKSLSLNDILNDLVTHIITHKVFTPIKKARILVGLGEIEYYLAGNVNSSIQLGAIISVIKSY